jgi:hypothetical protein
MASPIEQAPGWLRTLATSTEELARLRAEALEEIAKWRRGEPSRVVPFEEVLAWLDTLGTAGVEDGGSADHAPR